MSFSEFVCCSFSYTTIFGGGGCGINDGKSFERDLDYLLTFSFLVPAD